MMLAVLFVWELVWILVQAIGYKASLGSLAWDIALCSVLLVVRAAVQPPPHSRGRVGASQLMAPALLFLLLSRSPSVRMRHRKPHPRDGIPGLRVGRVLREGEGAGKGKEIEEVGGGNRKRTPKEVGRVVRRVR